MSLYVDVRINDRVVATAAIANLSNLAETSDYAVSVTETGHEDLGIPYINQQWMIQNHPRNSSVWSLIAKIAQAASIYSSSKEDSNV